MTFDFLPARKRQRPSGQDIDAALPSSPGGSFAGSSPIWSA